MLISLITGYLGSGKTTLLNRILTGDHGKKIAVIVNEFGEIGIDHEMVLHVEEDIYTLVNGCICCTVRDDMIEAVEHLMAHDDALEQIVIETTGLASPGSIVMTFLTHPDAGEIFTLDGVVTVVDAKHLPLHLDSSPEAAAQIAYADRILLNKIDLVTADDAARIEERIRAINPGVEIERTIHSETDPASLLDIGGFDPARITVPENIHNGPAHEQGISAIRLIAKGDIDLERFERWVDTLLSERHEDIYRMKGILSLSGEPKRYIFQAVHALSSWQYGRPWHEGERESRLVLIGRNLDRGKVEAGFGEMMNDG